MVKIIALFNNKGGVSKTTTTFHLGWKLADMGYKTLIVDVMGGWWIWEKQSDGTVTLTTECFENIALMLPFTFLLMWTAKEKLLKEKGRQICFTNILWYSTKVIFFVEGEQTGPKSWSGKMMDISCFIKG